LVKPRASIITSVIFSLARDPWLFAELAEVSLGSRAVKTLPAA
jgi:hypothetical protein